MTPLELPLGYRAEKINSDNLKDFVTLHREVFKSKIKTDFARNKFNTKPFSGIENIGYIVYTNDGEPVAFYGLFPVYANIGKMNVLVAQSGDTMTKPNHIGLGLFISSAQKTFRLCQQSGIKGVFGFPSPSSYRTFKKRLDWTFNEHLKRYSFFVPTLPLAYFAQKKKFLKVLYLWWVRIVLLLYKESGYFENSIIRNGQDGLLRDLSMWNYKMIQENNFAIKIGGIEVVIKLDGRLKIGDLNIDKQTEIKTIIKKLRWLSFLTFNMHLDFCVSPGVLLDLKLSKIKEAARLLPIGYLNLSPEHDLSTLKFTFFDLDTF